MRLVELFGPEGISVGNKPVAKNIEPPKTKELGRGIDASAFDHPTRPGSVIKIVRDISNPEKHPQVVFTNLAIENKHNPFFPKIYQAKLMPIGKRYEMVIEMEKLHPITGKNIRHMIPHIFEQLGIDPKNIKKIVGAGITSPKYDTDEKIKDKADDEFARNINTWRSRERMMKYSQNPEFKEALNILKQWENNFHYDLHAGNWMFRLTSVGPNLVLLDPFRDIP